MEAVLVVLDDRFVVHYVHQVVPVHVVEPHASQHSGRLGLPPTNVVVYPSHGCLVHLLLAEDGHVFHAGYPGHYGGEVQAQELLAPHDVQEVALYELEGRLDELRARVLLGEQPRLDAVGLVQLGLEELEAGSLHAPKLEELSGREEGMDVVVHQLDARRVCEVDQCRQLVLPNFVYVYRVPVGFRELSDEHGLEVRAAGCQYHLVCAYLDVVGDQGDVAEVSPFPHPVQVLENLPRVFPLDVLHLSGRWFREDDGEGLNRRGGEGVRRGGITGRRGASGTRALFGQFPLSAKGRPWPLSHPDRICGDSVSPCLLVDRSRWLRNGEVPREIGTRTLCSNVLRLPHRSATRIGNR